MEQLQSMERRVEHRVRRRVGLRVPCRGMLALLLLAGLSACASVTYQPKVTIGPSTERIPLRVEVRDLRDVSPPDDRKSAFTGGTAATSKDALAGELSTGVTDAILENLVLDEVFIDASRRPERPDLVVSGTIRRFYGKASQSNVGLVASFDPFGIGTLLLLLGLPAYESVGTVDLELTLDTPDGRRVAAYSAVKEFKERSSIYSAPFTGIGVKVNQSFSEVMTSVRQQMLADREKLAQVVSKPMPELQSGGDGATSQTPSEPR